MRAGQLKHYVTLQSPVRGTQSEYGEQDTEWLDVANVYARLEPLGAVEQQRAGQVVVDGNYRITIRHRGDVDTSWRIKYGTRYFAIQQIINTNERDRELQMVVIEAA